MDIPTNLKHKPVIVAQDYKNIDGREQGKGTTEGFSMGLAQWNDRGKVDASARVWRHTGVKWSSQAEELPLHMVLDLAIFVCKGLEYFREAYRYPKLYDPEHPQIGRVGLQGDAMTLEVCTNNEYIDEDIRLLNDVLSQDGELLGERLSLLADTLREMGYGRRKADQ